MKYDSERFRRVCRGNLGRNLLHDEGRPGFNNNFPSLLSFGFNFIKIIYVLEMFTISHKRGKYNKQQVATRYMMLRRCFLLFQVSEVCRLFFSKKIVRIPGCNREK